MITTKLLMKYVVGTINVNSTNTRIWVLEHDGTCESFKNAWNLAEKREKQEFKQFMNERYPNVQIEKKSDELYIIQNLEVIIYNITILHREDIA